MSQRQGPGRPKSARNVRTIIRERASEPDVADAGAARKSGRLRAP